MDIRLFIVFLFPHGVTIHTFCCRNIKAFYHEVSPTVLRGKLHGMCVYIYIYVNMFIYIVNMNIYETY